MSMHVTMHCKIPCFNILYHRYAFFLKWPFFSTLPANPEDVALARATTSSSVLNLHILIHF